MTPRPHITITPIHQHISATTNTFLLVVIFLGALALAGGTAYQAVQIDRQIGHSIN